MSRYGDGGSGTVYFLHILDAASVSALTRMA
jgi:hypothetical protein